MKFSIALNLLACMVLGSFSLALPATSPILDIEIIVHSKADGKE